MPCLRFNKHSQRLGSQIQHVLACYSTGLTALHFEGLTKMKKKRLRKMRRISRGIKYIEVLVCTENFSVSYRFVPCSLQSSRA